jgi:electron transport complex protein RnfG
MTPDGTITAVVVTNHTETPGLGTKATDRKVRKSLWQLFSGGGGEETSRTLPPSSYLDQYQRGLSAADAPFKVRGDGGRIDAVSGATISSRAVADAVSVVCQAFEKNRDTILQ